jgi:hypothetical protein
MRCFPDFDPPNSRIIPETGGLRPLATFLGNAAAAIQLQNPVTNAI